MPTFHQPKTLADLLITQVAPNWTKQRLIFVGGAVYPMGAVLARVGGKLQMLDPAGTGAAKVAYAVAAERVDATTADAVGLAIARGATLDLDELVFPAGITEAQKTAALTDLDVRGVVATRRI